MFVRFDPEAREARAYVLRQALGKVIRSSCGFVNEGSGEMVEAEFSFVEAGNFRSRRVTFCWERSTAWKAV